MNIALQAKSMLAAGNSMLQIRAAIDGAYGGLAPGTNTELPPA